MKKIFFLVMFMVSACVVALALPTVDIGSATTNAEALAKVLESLKLPMWTYVIIRCAIEVAKALKAIFPHIDGK